MAKDSFGDWLFLGLIVLGGLLAGYLLEKHLHILQNIIHDLVGPLQVAAPPVLVAPQPASPVPPPNNKKLYPNPLYDPLAEWNDADDAWYYMY